MFAKVTVAKPGLEILSVYVPGGTFANVYSPAPAVVAVFVSFVAVFRSSTVASGTTAPALSETVPSTMPEFEDCASAATPSDKTPRTKRAANRKRTSSFIFPPRFSWLVNRGVGLRQTSQRADARQPRRTGVVPRSVNRHGHAPWIDKTRQTAETKNRWLTTRRVPTTKDDALFTLK